MAEPTTVKERLEQTAIDGIESVTFDGVTAKTLPLSELQEAAKFLGSTGSTAGRSATSGRGLGGMRSIPTKPLHTQ